MNLTLIRNSFYIISDYLDFLLYVVEDESLRVDEVVRGVEGHSVQRAAVNTASIHRPATGFGPNQPLNRRNKTLRGERMKCLRSPVIW